MNRNPFEPDSRSFRLLVWIAQAVVAVILFQTLFFKFTGAEESVYIFKTVGMEPVGRYLAGVVELVAAVSLLIPSIAWIGAALALGTITGAIFLHLTVLGIVVHNDGGLLFGLALVVFFLSGLVLWLRRVQWLPVFRRALFMMGQPRPRPVAEVREERARSDP